MHFSMPAGISHLLNEQFPRQTAEQNGNIFSLQMKGFYQQQHMQLLHDRETGEEKKKKIPQEP